MSFKVKDVLTSLYQEAGQQFTTLLLGDEGMFSAMDMALCDIYTYQGTNWSFMYHDEEFIFPESKSGIGYLTTKVPISTPVAIFYFDNGKVTPFEYDLTCSRYIFENSGNPNTVYYTAWGNEIGLYKNGEKALVSYIGGYKPPTKTEDEVPLPNVFKSVFRDLTLHYLLGVQGQYGEQKSGDLYHRGLRKLDDLTKSSLLTIGKIDFKN